MQPALAATKHQGAPNINLISNVFIISSQGQYNSPFFFIIHSPAVRQCVCVLVCLLSFLCR